MQSRPTGMIIAAAIAVLFGVMTIYSGGSVLFGVGQAREAAGDFVPFVLWFNFLAGFAYIAAGIGLYLWRHWAIKLSMFIAIATLLVFAALGVHIMTGGAYETRTIGAMTLRSTLWLVIAFISHILWKKGRAA